MLKSIKFRPVVSGILACILFGLLLQGCSTKGSFLGFLKFWRSGDAEYAAQREKASTLMSSVRRQPIIPFSHYLLATYYQKQGYHRQAIDEFKKAVQIDPMNAAAYSAMGVSYDCLGAFEDARQSYVAALDIAHDADDVYNNLGYSYFLQGKYESAIENLKIAVALNPSNLRAYGNLGMANIETGEYALAIAALERTGSAGTAKLTLAKALSRKGDHVGAERFYAQAAAVDPGLVADETGTTRFLAQVAETVAKKSSETKTDAVGHAFAARSEKVDAGTRGRVGIEVANGNGVNGMARDVGQYLRQKGFRIARLTNAESFNYEEAMVYYGRGFEDVAHQLMQELPALRHKQEASRFGRSDVKVRVLLGKDVVPHKRLFASNGG